MRHKSVECGLTFDDVTQALRVQEVLQTGHLLLQLTHQTVVGVLVDDGVAADLLGAVCVPACARGGGEIM